MKESGNPRGSRAIGRAITSRLSYANVTATLALFVALGGSAYAVSANSIGSVELKRNAVGKPHIKNNAVAAAELRRNAVRKRHIRRNSVASAELRPNAVRTPHILDGAVTEEKLAEGIAGQPGPQGPAGPAGPQGPQGPQGPPGDDATIDGAGVMMGRINGLPAEFAESYGFPSGVSTPGTEAEREMVSPNVPVVARDLFVRLTNPPGDFANRVFVLRVNGSLTALNCTVAGGSATCPSNAAVSIAPGSRIALQASSNAALLPAPTDAMVSFRMTMPLP